MATLKLHTSWHRQYVNQRQRVDGLASVAYEVIIRLLEGPPSIVVSIHLDVISQ